LHPWREDIAKDAPGFLDAEWLYLRFVLHERRFLAMVAQTYSRRHSAEKDTRATRPEAL